MFSTWKRVGRSANFLAPALGLYIRLSRTACTHFMHSSILRNSPGGTITKPQTVSGRLIDKFNGAYVEVLGFFSLK